MLLPNGTQGIPNIWGLDIPAEGALRQLPRFADLWPIKPVSSFALHHLSSQRFSKQGHVFLSRCLH